MTVDFLKEEFGFSGRETVAIMGAHTFGRFHKPESLYPYVWTSYGEALWNNDYYKYILFVDTKLSQINLTSEILFLHLKESLQVKTDITSIISTVKKAPMQKVTNQKLCGFLITEDSLKMVDHTSGFT